MEILRKHIFLVIGLAVLAYFGSLDLEGTMPSVTDVALFAVGFVSMAIYVVQSFVRVRRTPKGGERKVEL